MKTYKFPCGCEFPLDENGGCIIREHEFNPNCPDTYKLISEGRTIGCFQIESQLLIQWCKKIKPKSLNDMCDLVAIVRPGTLKSVFKTIKDGDKIKNYSAAEWYVMVRNKEVPIEYFDPSLEPILKSTNGIMLFQEQMLQIAVQLANFTEVEADLLRRGIGKKLASVISECKKLFVNKAEEFGVLSRAKAEELFHQIEAANRYSFNKSHSYCYGVTAYESAYLKQHFPLEFFCSALRLSVEEQDPFAEMRRIVGDAKKHNYSVYGPNIDDMKDNFYIKDESVVFGIGNIKGMGENTVKKLFENLNNLQISTQKPLKEWSWFDFLINLTVSKEGSVVGSSNLLKLIQSGAIDRDVSRKRMVFELENWDILSKGEKEWVLKNKYKFTNLKEALIALGKTKKEGGGCHKAERIPIIQSIVKLIEKPPTNLDDTIESLSKMESEILGLALSCSLVEACDLTSVNCTIDDYLKGKSLQWFILGVECKGVNVITVKNGASAGQEMAFLQLEDATGQLDDCVAFSDEWARFNYLLQPGNCVLIEGQRDRKKGSFIVKHVEQI